MVKCFYYKNATHLIAISKETKGYAKMQFGYSDNQISIVHHGVPDKFLNLISEKDKREYRVNLGLPTDKILILLVGSIEPRKGHDILLRSVQCLPDALRNKIHIVFLGSDKSQTKQNRDWLMQSINETGLSDSVSCFEYQSSELFYKISDVFVLPSWLEGFPVVTLEAMTAGCLCIRSNAEGASEQIIDGETGFIFEKGNHVQLKDILEKIIANEDLRKTIASNGRKYAVNHFTSDIMAKNTIEIYKLIDKNCEN